MKGLIPSGPFCCIPLIEGAAIDPVFLVRIILVFRLL